MATNVSLIIVLTISVLMLGTIRSTGASFTTGHEEFVVADHRTCIDVANETPYDCLGPTKAFFTNETRVHEWVKFDNVTTKHSITWTWTDASGKAYSQFNNTFGDNGPGWYVEQGEISTWYAVDHAHEPFGRWEVRVYVDGQYLFSDFFTLSPLDLRVPLLP